MPRQINSKKKKNVVESADVWMVTIINGVDHKDDVELFTKKFESKSLPPDVKHIIGQYELAPTTNNLHTHFVLHLTRPRSSSWIKRWIAPRCRLKVVYNHIGAWNYCTKPGGWGTYVFNSQQQDGMASNVTPPSPPHTT